MWKSAPSGRLMPWMRVTEALEKAIPAWSGLGLGLRLGLGLGLGEVEGEG